MNENFEPNFTDEQSSDPAVNESTTPEAEVIPPVTAPLAEEKVGAGIVGAFLFALVGGILWFLLYQIGFLAAISGIVGVVCAIKGYSIFAKRESIKGVVISIIATLVVIVIAWYFCLAYDVYKAYQEWFAAGEIDFTITFSEAVSGAYMFLEDSEIALAYFKDLGLGVLLCIIGSVGTIRNALNKAKAEK